MEQKAVCGGFLVGDGLEMNGKVLSATGGGSGVKYIECRGDSNLENIQCEFTANEIIDMYKNGEYCAIRLIAEGSPVEQHLILTPISYVAGYGDILPESVTFSYSMYVEDAIMKQLACAQLTIKRNETGGTFTAKVYIKDLT